MSYEEASNQAIAELNQNSGQSSGTQEASGDAPYEGQQQIDEKSEPAQQEPTQTVGGDPSWNPQQWQLKYRDQTIVPKDRSHLINLAQQGYSYSQRMQELKAREEELNGKHSKYSQYEQLEQAFEKNPQFREQLFNLYNQSLTPGQQKQAQEGQAQSSVPPEILKEIQELKGWKSQFEQFQQAQQEQQADQEVANEIESLKGKYNRDDWDMPSSNGKTLLQEICEHAYKNGGIKLETAYRDLMWDSHMKSQEANGRKAAADSLAQAKKAGIVSGGRSKGAVAPSQINPAAMDYNEIERHIKQEYGINS